MAILPNNNIDVIAVRDALGESSTDIGTLCRSPKINPWAKYKPVRYQADATEGHPDWWKTVYRNCGITFNQFGYIPDMVNAQKGGKAIVVHDIPRGGQPEPFRLGDFRGYNHDAIRYFGFETDIDQKTHTSSDINSKMTVRVKFIEPMGSYLSISDCELMIDKYLGLCLVCDGVYKYATMNIPIKNMNIGLSYFFEFPIGFISYAGTKRYDGYFFYADKSEDLGEFVTANKYYAVNPLSYNVNVFGTGGGGGGGESYGLYLNTRDVISYPILYRATITVKTTANLKDVTIKFIHNSNSAYNKIFEYGDMTVYPGNNYVPNEIASVNLDDYTYNYKVYLYIDDEIKLERLINVIN